MPSQTSDITAVKPKIGSPYPASFSEPCAARERKALGDRQERDVVHYADIDMVKRDSEDMVKRDSEYLHRDGTPYPRRTEK